jgi:hypothetical protein
VRRWGTGWPAAAFASWLAASCVTGSYDRVTVDEPIRDEQLAALRPGTDDLARCLEALGAPQRVLEYRVDAELRSGMALVWTWRESAGWGIEVTAEVSGVSEEASGSFKFNQSDIDLPGCVLWFGPDLVLERWRSGTLGELLPTRRRPAPAVL